jgi:hypothetical protein
MKCSIDSDTQSNVIETAVNAAAVLNKELNFKSGVKKSNTRGYILHCIIDFNIMCNEKVGHAVLLNVLDPESALTAIKDILTGLKSKQAEGAYKTLLQYVEASTSTGILYDLYKIKGELLAARLQ